MRKLWLACLFPIVAVAYGPGSGHGSSRAHSGGVHSGFTGSHGSGHNRRFSAGHRYFGTYPYWDGYFDYDYGPGYGDEPEEPPEAAGPRAPVVMVQAPPPKPIHPQIKEYNPPPGDSSPFTIAFKSGDARSALAVWVTDDTLHYVSQEGKPANAPLDSIDRQATKRLNPSKNVQAWLP